MTPAEKILWQEVRAKKLGVRFRRQQVIQGFIVDFYCHKAGLVIEVDGDIHDLQKEEDVRREKALSEMGLRIFRFRNEEVERDLAGVLRRVREKIGVNESPSRRIDNLTLQLFCAIRMGRKEAADQHSQTWH